MNDHETLLQMIRRSASPLLAPQPLEHSQRLREVIPPVRRHIGPRAWYQVLEEVPAKPDRI
jgi:hypothetical protein